MNKLWKITTNKTPFFFALVAAVVGGFFFSFIGTPVPWLLGPIAATMIASRFKQVQLRWSPLIRNIGLMIIGYTFGLALTKEALIEIGNKLPSMLVLTVLLVLFCAGIAYLVSKLTGVNYPTILTGSIPGGLSQMIIFAEEVKGIDVTTVSFLQVSRLLMIVFTVPFIMLLGPFASTADLNAMITGSELSGQLFPNGLIYIGICLLMAFIGQKIHAPTPYLLGPIVGTAILNLTIFQAPYLPSSILDASQLMVGGYIGLLLKPEQLKSKTKMISLALISGLFMILGSMALSLILIRLYGVSISTSFLSLAPGGMDQMGILAHEANADISMVTGFQIFRLLFIFFVVPPLLKWVFQRTKNKEHEEQKLESGAQ
jgi:uncharacterized protein